MFYVSKIAPCTSLRLRPCIRIKVNSFGDRLVSKEFAPADFQRTVSVDQDDDLYQHPYHTGMDAR